MDVNDNTIIPVSAKKKQFLSEAFIACGNTNPYEKFSELFDIIVNCLPRTVDKISDIDTSTLEGRMLYAAVALLASESRTTQRDDAIVAEIFDLQSSIFRDTPIGEPAIIIPQT
jgi:hypothetical protein